MTMSQGRTKLRPAARTRKQISQSHAEDHRPGVGSLGVYVRDGENPIRQQPLQRLRPWPPYDLRRLSILEKDLLRIRLRCAPCRICRGLERAVYNPFFSTFMLAIEAQRVIELRLVRLAWGGSEGLAEAQSMVIEKIHAAGEAMTTLMLGGSPASVIARYREHVALNTKRLMTA